uniref:Uncharacterized protein n=1 Tax=Glossina pallidipes TaxID=7398 RepID=A0A1B0AI99_GLOPL
MASELNHMSAADIDDGGKVPTEALSLRGLDNLTLIVFYCFIHSTGVIAARAVVKVSHKARDADYQLKLYKICTQFTYISIIVATCIYHIANGKVKSAHMTSCNVGRQETQENIKEMFNAIFLFTYHAAYN